MIHVFSEKKMMIMGSIDVNLRSYHGKNSNLLLIGRVLHH